MKFHSLFRDAYFLVILGAVIAGSITSVLAYNSDFSSGDPVKFGHSADEMHVNIPGTGVVTLQQAIEQGLLGGAGGPPDIKYVSDQITTGVFYDYSGVQYHEVSCAPGDIAIAGGGACESILTGCWDLAASEPVLDVNNNPVGWRVGCAAHNTFGCSTTIKVNAACASPGSGQIVSGGSGTYVGATFSGGPNGDGQFDGDDAGSYAAADSACNTDYPGSRVCTSADFSNGLPDKEGWFNTFESSISALNRDCVGWTSDVPTYYGQNWGNPAPVTDSCAAPNPYLCCTESISGGSGSSSAATYVGATTATYDGLAVGGYSGGDAKCAAEFGANTRMCASADFANGRPDKTGWYNTFTLTNPGTIVNDCSAWSSNAVTASGPLMWAGSDQPAYHACSFSHEILCCAPASGGGSDSPSSMYLRTKIGDIPALCPSGWSEADFTREQVTPTTRNELRICYANDKSCESLYLTTEAVGPDPPACPSGWSEADFTREQVTPTTRNELRICYANDKSCESLYLTTEAVGPDPPACPSGWSEADFQEVYSDTITNWVRTCYRCGGGSGGSGGFGPPDYVETGISLQQNIPYPITLPWDFGENFYIHFYRENLHAYYSGMWINTRDEQLRWSDAQSGGTLTRNVDFFDIDGLNPPTLDAIEVKIYVGSGIPPPDGTVVGVGTVKIWDLPG